MIDKLLGNSKILVAGHRGCLAKYPENTMVSFEKAIELGVDMIEMDINITKDKQLIVMHDNLVDRTTDGTGFSHDKTLEEIKSLDAGIRFSEKFAGTKVPTFREFMDLVSKSDSLLLNVEIKEKTFETVDLTIAMLKEYNFLDRCVITCFDAAIVKYAYTKYHMKTQGFPDDMMPNFEDGKNGTRSTLYSVGIPMARVTKELVESYNNENIKPWSWTVNDEETTLQSIESGITLVTSNDPEVPLRIFREKGLHK